MWACCRTVKTVEIPSFGMGKAGASADRAGAGNQRFAAAWSFHSGSGKPGRMAMAREAGNPSGARPDWNGEITVPDLDSMAGALNRSATGICRAVSRRRIKLATLFASRSRSMPARKRY
jgi:hypothetical protein